MPKQSRILLNILISTQKCSDTGETLSLRGRGSSRHNLGSCKRGKSINAGYAVRPALAASQGYAEENIIRGEIRHSGLDPESSCVCHCEKYRVWRGLRGNLDFYANIKQEML